ncbi:hypothetical protein CGLO_02319 [Colletotrichum gloeosporioides Cg-14]|uniref:Uncharacterized protein n=1 Tax=Colletotrichum gloeosporioides (strain Cg-14) TaxID=1237896 RepID=T0M968_COLGC|nr:hypothetical protein CGLO_02319 [Colletotrichum gloeosporioides Cg-14]
MALLAHIWRSSMRAQAGHLDNGQLWDLIIRRNWTSVTVTITAAVIRVCLGFQMGIFTAMVASLLIERTGVPIGSAPLISMLRAVSTSPYNLVSRRTLTTPLAFAISLAVLLTGASNFISTALLIDFENINIITPKQTVGLLYGSSQQEDAFGVGTSTDPSGSSGIGTLRGSKIWNSQPNSYYRFAELRNDASPDIDLDQVEDSGTALRAILPFTNVANRTNLREYEGPSVVFDSRVDVSMSSDQDGSELSLSWDNVKDVYETASIRDQYINLGDDKASRNMRGTLDLDGKTRWELRNNMSLEDGGSQYDLSNWMIFNSVSGGLPYMNLNGVAETFEVLAGGILVPGAFSPYAVHYAHAALFQDVVKTTGKLTQGLQALFTVLRQMAYYENSPYFNHESMAVMTTSSEKLIPTQWTGFIVVAVTITAHLILLTIITVLFLGWTKASWLGNVWASLSQVVSSETEDLIDRSTDKNDEAVEKMIMAGTSVADGKLTYRVRVKRNEASGRNELSLI